MPAASSVIPKAIAAIMAVGSSGAQNKRPAISRKLNPIPVKTAMNLMGLGVGPLRMPLCQLDDGKKERLLSALHQKNLI